MSRCLILQRLHPLNLGVAWAWSWFAPVFYWKREHVRESWARRFTMLHSEEYFTLDDWQRETERAFETWRAIPMEKRAGVAPVLICGVSVDYAGAWSQWLALQFEEQYLFASLVARRHAAHAAEARVAAFGLHGSGLPRPSWPLSLRAVRGLAVFDRAWLMARALGAALKQAARLFRHVGNLPTGRRWLLWTGISASEVASHDQRLTFAFLVERGLLKPEECLFMLASPPSRAAAARLERLGVAWSTVSTFGFLPLRHKLSALPALAMAALRAMFSLGSPRGAVVAQYVAESIPWIATARALDSRVYLSSVSVCWPERPEVAALSAMGLRTINWSYGANTFLYQDKDRNFHDLGLSRSLSVAREVWIWTKEVERWLRARSLGAPPTIRTIGPVMGGDSRWLARSPKAARAAFGLAEVPGRKLLAVFDVPAVRRELRHVPTMYPVEMLEQFFRDLESLLARCPQLAVLVKPKRALSDAQRDFADSMQRIVDLASALSRAGRVITVPHDIDPYIPVAVADLCLGIPFTSPVLVASYSGRPALFHDPLRTVNHVPGAPELMGQLTHGTDELIERVERALAEGFSEAKVDDPGERFARLLREAPA